MHFFQASLSKAKKGSSPDLVTGGNWKKSPVTTTWDVAQFNAGVCALQAGGYMHLYASKRHRVFPQLRPDEGQLIKEVCIYHGY